MGIELQDTNQQTINDSNVPTRYGPDATLTQNRGMGPRTRQKNKDENPQEFEEAESQDEQSNNQLIPGNNRRAERAQQNYRRDQQQQIQDRPAIEHPQRQDLRDDSMQANEFNIKMNKSITDSAQNKSEHQPVDEGMDDDLIRETGQRTLTIQDMDQDFGRPRSHQLDPLLPGGKLLHESGSMVEGKPLDQLPFGHQKG